MECILFTVEGQRLRLSATDLEMTIQKWIPMSTMAFADEAIAIPGKLINDLVAVAPEGDIQLEIDQISHDVTFTAGTSKSTIKCIDPTEFPPLAPDARSRHCNIAGRSMEINRQQGCLRSQR